MSPDGEDLLVENIAEEVGEEIEEGVGEEIEDEHPRHIYEHEHDDTVCGKDCVFWIKEWYRWALRPRARGKGPFTSSSEDQGALDLDVDGQGRLRCPERLRERGCHTSVWFLAYPMYSYRSGGTVVKHVNVTLGRWHFLAPVYTCHPSNEIYPSMYGDELVELAKKDVDSVYSIDIKLDGINLGGCQVPIKRPFTVELDPARNIFGIDDKDLKRGRGGKKNTMNIVSDGYWIWLKELPIGDHLLTTRAYSPVYRLDMEYHLYVRGPSKRDCPVFQEPERPRH